MNQNNRKTAKQVELAELLTLFSALPDDAFTSLPVVCALYSRCRASIWRDVKAGRCPAPVSVGPRCTRWRVGDLRADLGAK